MSVSFRCINLYYRGYHWFRGPGGLVAEIFNKGRREFACIYDDQLNLEIQDAARLVWEQVRDTRHSWRSGARNGRDIDACDRIPWEIHEILDEDAYKTALASYLTNL